MKRFFILICTLFVVVAASAQHSRKIGDIITINGRQGIVFSTSADGKHGKVLSIDRTSLKWDDCNAWCAHLGKGWRLPTKNELKEVYANKDIIEAAFVAAGLQTFSEYERYWSSDVVFEINAWTVRMDDGLCYDFKKDYELSVRAVSAF